MFSAYENSLYYKNKDRFKDLEDATKEFNAVHNGDNIIQDDIFNVLKNYSEKKDYPFDLFRYPVDDEDFCACTFIREANLCVGEYRYAFI